jgi:hypothetical protein
MYIFAIIVFIAELIIALQLIGFILKADREVCRINACVEAFNPLAQTCLQYVRCLISNFNKSFEKIFELIKKKRQQVISNTFIMLSIYLILILFRIKTKKFSKIYKLVGAIRDVAIEFAL